MSNNFVFIWHPFYPLPYEFDYREHGGDNVPQGELAEEEAEDQEVDCEEDEALPSDPHPSPVA